jgi:hypothetical protein
MNNNFNLKQFLAEGKLLKEETSSDLKKIFDKVIEDDRESFQEFPHIIEDPEVRDDYEHSVQNAKYGTIEELAESLYDTWVVLSHGDSDFGDFIVPLIRICKEMNFKSTKELIRACIDNRYGDYYNEEEKEEYFNNFEDELEGL